MTLQELVPMLTGLGFDCSAIPARRGNITLSELSYDEIEQEYWFRFRWKDITLGVAPSAFSNDVWEQIKEHASVGESDTFIFGQSKNLGYTDDSIPNEIAQGITKLLDAFTVEMERITEIVRPWMIED